MNHHRVGSYNWSLLNISQKISPAYIAESNEVARLMMDIATDLGTTHSCRSDGTSGGSTYTYMLTPALNKYGLTGNMQPETTTTIKADTIRENLSRNMPLLMTAANTYHVITGADLKAGHIWIIDGLSERYRDYYTWSQGWVGEDDYFMVWKYKQMGVHVHFNWGWDGNSDGWYRYFTPVNTDYSFANYKLITQIQPKK